MSLLCPIMIFDDGDEYVPMYAGAFFVKPSNIDPIIEGLIKYKNTYTDDEINKINKDKEYEINHYHSDKKESLAKRNRGYVYVLKCANKYKIGFSKNVDKRIRQLDTRPFELELIFSIYSNNAYMIEQELHKKLETYKETGEWYSNIDEQMIKNMIEEIAGYLGCDIQY